MKLNSLRPSFGFLAFLVSISAILALSGTAVAGNIDPAVLDSLGQATFFGTDGENTWMMQPTFSSNNVDSTGVFDLDMPNMTPGSGTFSVEGVNVNGNVDPIISTSFDVVNNTGSTQDYTFIFTIPIVPLVPATITGGSTGITITDTNGGGSGATLGTHTNGRPTYFSQIDGGDYVSIDLSPIVEPNNFESETDSGAFGTPIPSLIGPAATSTIGIRYDFSLTAGDRAAVTGVFVVEPVPEPAAAMMLISGMLVMIPKRHRA